MHGVLISGLRCPNMNADGWLADTRISYDTVAVSYADQLRDALAGEPYLRAALALFADLVRAAGGGPVADVGCARAPRSRPTSPRSANLAGSLMSSPPP
jgi:hypothetical protein